MAKSTNNSKNQASRRKLPTEVSFEYLKASSHRVVLVHGAHGGPTPNGKHISMTVYSERFPIPQKETFAIVHEGKFGELRIAELRIGKLKQRTARDAIIRECDVTLMMDIGSATAIRDWLSENIKKLKELPRK